MRTELGLLLKDIARLRRVEGKLGLELVDAAVHLLPQLATQGLRPTRRVLQPIPLSWRVEASRRGRRALVPHVVGVAMSITFNAKMRSSMPNDSTHGH